jgi:hypothetical protein
MDKLNFLLTTLPDLLRKLDPSTERKWGKMNVQQMIEHFSDSVREANGKDKKQIFTEADKLPLYKNFLMSDKAFRPETKNPIMPDEPVAVRNKNKEEAIAELENELTDFADHFKNNPESINTQPVFGELNYNEWIQLLHKHAVHHLKQFGVEV